MSEFLYIVALENNPGLSSWVCVLFGISCLQSEVLPVVKRHRQDPIRAERYQRGSLSTIPTVGRRRSRFCAEQELGCNEICVH